MILRLALFVLTARRRRLLALLGLAFVAIRFLYRRRKAREVASGRRPIEGVGTSTGAFVGTDPGTP